MRTGGGVIGVHAVSGAFHTGALVDAQIPATITRDTELGPPAPYHTMVKKTVDETVNNSATLQDDNALLFAIGSGAGERYTGRFTLLIVGDVAADIKFDISVPAGASGTWAIYREPVLVAQAYSPTFLAIGGGSANAFCSGGNQVIDIDFEIAGGGTAGNVVLQWAQFVAVVADTIIKAGSTLTVHRRA